MIIGYRLRAWRRKNYREACHMIDVCVYLTGSLIKSVCMNSLGNVTNSQTDNASILLKFENGSNGTVNYFSNGSKNIARKELKFILKNQHGL